jgi:hypothetical protein
VALIEGGTRSSYSSLVVAKGEVSTESLSALRVEKVHKTVYLRVEHLAVGSSRFAVY